MPYLSEDKINAIVENVVARLQAGEGRVPLAAAVRDAMGGGGSAQVNPPFGCSPTKPRTTEAPAGASSAAPMAAFRPSGGIGRGVFADIDSAITAAREAFSRYNGLGLATRYAVIREMRAEAHKHVDYIARAAVEETGLGRVDQKVMKNRLVIDKTPGPEILEPWAESGDDGLVLQEYAPWGVVGAITPTTNPTETIICNALGMLSAGNAVVFNCHPGAKKVSAYTVQFLNEAIIRAGGPENLIACVAEPTIESAQGLMRHKGIRLVVVTGGPGVVKEALASGKKVIAGGPGNPPVVVDETADLEAAGDGIVKGIGLDNNIVCTAEKEIFAVASIADGLKAQLIRHGAYELKGDEISRVEKLVVDNGHAHKNWVGKDVQKILREVGINASEHLRICFAEVPEQHPFVQAELLMPVSGLVRVADVREGIAAAVRAEHGFGHTASMWSKNIENMHVMARAVNTSIFVKNAPTFAGLGLGGEGYTSFTIASPTGEGLTNARHFARVRRCTLKEYFRIV